MKNSLIVKISEGLGNQLFMYANAFALSKDKHIELLIDDTSGFFNKKNKLRGQKYLLNYFNINEILAPDRLKPDTNLKHFLKKINLKLNLFIDKKNYLSEKTHLIDNKKKIINMSNYQNINFTQNVFIQGNYENENYFKKYRIELIDLFSVKSKFLTNNKYHIDKLTNTNSVSLHVRQNRFSDQKINKDKVINVNKSKEFLQNNLEYIDKSINFFNSKFNDATFFIWSNDFTGLNDFFSKYPRNKIYFIKNNDAINDFNLFKYSKHFIVGPSTFHWWGAWLNNSPNKICLRPNNINPSNNNNFWPKRWIPI
jgi:hypothetical protein